MLFKKNGFLNLNYFKDFFLQNENSFSEYQHEIIQNLEQN